MLAKKKYKNYSYLKKKLFNFEKSKLDNNLTRSAKTKIRPNNFKKLKK